MKNLLFSGFAVILIIEEWLWDILTVIGHTLVLWLHLERLERWLKQTSPTVALIAFMIPVLIVTPINLAALWLLANGLIMEGVLLEIVAKLLGTLMVTRVFALTKAQLLTFSAFNLIYTTIMRWLHWAHEKITETAVYRYAKRMKTEVKARFQAWFKTQRID